MLNRAQVHVISIAVLVMVLPSLYRVEKEVKNAATQDQVRELNSKFDALDEKMQKALERIELWQEKKKTLQP